MTEWLAMGGYAGYVWGSYSVCAAAIAIELWRLRVRRLGALRAARIEAEVGIAG
ncbi:MAG: heme exporter protein CcmD [Burkholderiales bacterium]|nr:heme exporter protein CcmD [Burkholderiales bacterium]